MVLILVPSGRRDSAPPQGESVCGLLDDFDNNGHLDIFQAAGGGLERRYRSLMLLNLGEGLFLDVTEGVGLLDLVAVQALGAGLAEIDNDGDLDLVVAEPHLLYLNDGDGTFVNRTDWSGIADAGINLSFGDCDLDGFLDVVFGNNSGLDQFGGLFFNHGGSHHWLRVELVGRESNRSGIGARLIAISGDLRQMREIFGGLGYNQDEMVAHFGLGERTQVDRLEIRWPSGQVDVLTDIPADQKIRVIEGRGEYHVVHPTTWESFDLPDRMEPVELFGYDALRFAVHPGDASGTALELTLGGQKMNLLAEDPAAIRVDLEDRSWQVIRIPLASMGLTGKIPFIAFSGRLQGTFYLDDIRLVAARPSSAPVTAVTEARTVAVPLRFTLAQNYPNPFNSSTVIRFALPEREEVELALFNLAGQKVATLVQGVREAGTYTVRWDGRDDAGRDLASGMYLYRLRAGPQQVATRKMLLVR